MTDMIPGLHLSARELVIVLGSAVLVLSRWLPTGARRRTALGAAGAVAAGAALSASALRWQLLVVLAADLLVAAGAAVAWSRRRRQGRAHWRAPWWLALPGSLACLALVAAGGVAA